MALHVKMVSSYRINLPQGNSWIEIYPELPFDTRVGEDLYKDLWNLHPQDYAEIKIFGKTFQTPRWHQSYGKSYKFSGISHKCSPIKHRYLKKLLNWVNSDNKTGATCNQILVNWYRDGNHYMGEHSDDESQLVPRSNIYSFSYGQQRDFVIKSKNKIDSYRKVIAMKNNSLIVMGGETQIFYKHCVPKRALSKCPASRINITLRAFV